jgi:hypothetical protein
MGSVEGQALDQIGARHAFRYTIKTWCPNRLQSETGTSRHKPLSDTPLKGFARGYI